MTESAESDCQQAQLTAIERAAIAGCQLIQIREKDLSARALCEFVRAAVQRLRPYGARVLVNDRLDVALATGADGVHLRSSSLAATDVREIVRQRRSGDFLIGVSTHTLAEAVEAESCGADFIVFGPVFSPLSKKAETPVPGLTGLADICRAVRLPVLGLGGIQTDNARDVMSQGAAGIAAISLFTDLSNLSQHIARISA